MNGVQNLRALQKQEAVERLKILQDEYLLHKNVLKEFEEDETIYYSENLGGPYSAILYWLKNKDTYVKAVKEIEEKKQIYVYHCMVNHTEIGDLISMLYVSQYKEDWKLDKEDLKTGLVYAYVKNFSGDCNSEFGGIQITGINGGLARIY